MWLLSGGSRFPGLVGAPRSFSAAHNSCPMVHGVTAVLPAWVTLDETPNLGSGVLTALGFKSWLLCRLATGIVDTFPIDLTLFPYQESKGWDLLCKALPRSLLHPIPCL